MSDEDLLLGDPTIDQQHAELFRSFRRLSDAPDNGFPAELASEILSALSVQIFRHFKTEDALMEGLGMPELMLHEHRAAHLSIIEELTVIHLEMMAGKTMEAPELIEKVANWVRQHLLEFDLKLRLYIAKKAP